MSWMENLNWFDQIQVLHITDFYQVSGHQLAEVNFTARDQKDLNHRYTEKQFWP